MLSSSNVSKGTAFLYQGVTDCGSQKLIRYNNIKIGKFGI